MCAIRVVVADDHPSTLRGATEALRMAADIEVVATAPNGNAAITALTEHAPDVAVLDYVMGGATLRDILAHLRSTESPTRVLVHSAFIEPQRIAEALEDGASGYLSKSSQLQDLIDAVRAIAAGRRSISADVAEQLAIAVQQRGRVKRAALTTREAELLRLLATGYRNADIAAELAISGSTVKTHLERLYEKLDVTGRAQAVEEAHRRGLL